MMLWSGPSDCLEDLMNQSTQRSKYDALFANVSRSPLLFLPLFSDVGANLDSVWHLTSSCLQTSLDELCGPAETLLTRIEHREYRSLLEKLQWLQLQSRPDLSYEVNRAAQRSSAPTIADARALNAIAQGSAILGNHFEVSTRSDRCVHGSVGDVWRCLFCQHGRFEEPVRCHRVFDA